MDSSSVRVREGLSSVTRGTLFLLTATLLFVLLTFVARVIIVRSISTEEWSAFSWGLTLAGFLAAFGTLGLPNAIARSLPYANSDAERRAMVRGSVVVAAFCGAAVTIVLWVVGPAVGNRLGEPDIGLALQFFSVAVGASIVANVLAAVFQGYEDVTPNALFLQIVNPLLFVAFLGAVLFTHGFAFPKGTLGTRAPSSPTPRRPSSPSGSSRSTPSPASPVGSPPAPGTPRRSRDSSTSRPRCSSPASSPASRVTATP